MPAESAEAQSWHSVQSLVLGKVTEGPGPPDATTTPSFYSAKDLEESQAERWRQLREASRNRTGEEEPWPRATRGGLLEDRPQPQAAKDPSSRACRIRGGQTVSLAPLPGDQSRRGGSLPTSGESLMPLYPHSAHLPNISWTRAA